MINGIFFSLKEKLVIKILFRDLDNKRKQKIIDYIVNYIEKNKSIFIDVLYKNLNINKNKVYEITMLQLYKLFPREVERFANFQKRIDKKEEELYKEIKKYIKEQNLIKLINNNNKISKIRNKEKFKKNDDLKSLEKLLESL